MSTFSFKRFDVVNERSAMKVNTDGVLLGAAVTIHPDDRYILDIGTGTGTIALMSAQRLSDILGPTATMHIDAIDIDELSAMEASDNFSKSPWSTSLRAHHASLCDFADSTSRTYDLVFSNPPYFEDSLTAPDGRKSTARHTAEGLSYRDILEFASSRLSDNGRVSLILPADQEVAVCRYARMCGLFLFRILRIRTVPRKQPCRVIMEFSRNRCDGVEDSGLTIQKGGEYTPEYLLLTKDFYLFA